MKNIVNKKKDEKQSNVKREEGKNGHRNKDEDEGEEEDEAVWQEKERLLPATKSTTPRKMGPTVELRTERVSRESEPPLPGWVGFMGSGHVFASRTRCTPEHRVLAGLLSIDWRLDVSTERYRGDA